MHTEEQAKECWCPFALSQDFVSKRERVLTMGGPHNRLSIIQNGSSNDGQNANAYCIASACAAWRWDMAWESATEEGQGGDLVIRLKRLQGEPKRGYCGLAGQPS